MRRCILLTAVALALLGGVARADPPYAPPSRPGPLLDVSPSGLQEAFKCSSGVDHAKRAPVLLLPGTGASADDNFSWNYEPALSARGIAWCSITFPFDGNGDIQTNGEYVAWAIRTMYARTGRRIAIIGHSQGGMVPRWALRFWPDTRKMVDDVIGFAPSNHGTTQASFACQGSCIEANWQQAYESNFIRALNSYQETFAGISYTNVYTHDDEVVEPNMNDQGSSSLHTGDGRIANVAVQDVCPTDSSDHDLLGTVDAVAYALAMDALDHDGPADRSRIPAAVCAQPYMPGINPVTGPGAGLKALADDESSTGPTTASEPPLDCYVFAAGCFQSVAGKRACTAPRLALSPSRGARVRRATVYVDGRLVRRLRGRRLRSVSLGQLRSGRHRVRIVVETADGARWAISLRTRACAAGRRRARKLAPPARVRRGGDRV